MPSAAKVSIAWGPGEQLVASCGEGPDFDLTTQNSISRPFLSLYFQAHVLFEFGKQDVLKSSKEYRALILDCLTNLIKEEGKQIAANNSEEANLATMSLELVRDCHCVWHFVEAVYLSDGLDDRHISVRLTEWYLECFPDLKVKYRQMLSSLKTGIFNEDELWALATALVAAGARSLALDLLRLRPHGTMADTEKWADAAGAAAMGVKSKKRQGSSAASLGTAESLLRECPEDVVAARKDGRWEKWQGHCLEWVHSEELANDPRNRKLLGVLAGNMTDMAEACSDWQHMLVACTAYGRAQPGVIQSRQSSDAVGLACGDAGVVFPPPRHIVGGALTEAAMGNPGGMLICLGVNANTYWFAAHLCHLLVVSEVITETGPPEWTNANREIGIREFYLKEFAGSLERHPGMWRIAVFYFRQCPTVGAPLLAAMLSRVAFDGPADPSVEKVLRLCGQHRWLEGARGVCETVGAGCLESGNYGGALFWFARGALRERALEVANEALMNAERQGPASGAARDLQCVVSALGTIKDVEKPTSLPQVLDYLRVYSEFQTAILRCGEAKAGEKQGVAAYIKHRAAALDSILRLIGGGGLARKHWAVALREVAVLVNTFSEQIPTVEMGVVQELLSALELVSGVYTSPELLVGLQRRVFFEISESTTDDEMQNTVSLKDTKRSLVNVRRAFISAVSRAGL